ncbi:patatin-like phospholipase family protein [Prescottella subtropica]|uniref:patatin-like phospholipase family protein n=1 Tax=Prescottella subtropica TaxID=2545757 RepID=UPI0010F82DA4|nr:patatin-like phospholipase family protein [Prescottella subtropica]
MTAHRTGLVVAGAGARGAYEAGALSELVPWMASTGPRPSVFVGTSAGALNVVALAGLTHLTPVEAVTQLTETWSAVRLHDVFGLASGIDTGARYLGQLTGVRTRLPSLLDTERLRGRLSEWLPLDTLHRNVDDGLVAAVAVTTTSVATGGTVVFVEKHPSVPLPPPDTGRDITYVETRLTVDHVLASAAVPLLFRPVQVREPERWTGWYVDGGLRLNAPLSPAIAFGCDRLGVVATQPMTRTVSPPPRARGRTHGEPAGDGVQPDVYAVGALAMRVLLADRMIEDLHRLAGAPDPVDIVFAGPPADRRGDIAALADDAFRTRYGTFGMARNPSMWMLSRLIGGDPDDHGNLLSYLFFDPAFTRRAARLGRRHARHLLGTSTGDG